jgi:DNA-binding FadR family transcriptional regulator
MTLAAQVARQVEGLITSGEWPVGTRIPPENALVERLGVSRNTVREALRSLSHHEQLLEAIAAGDSAGAERSAQSLIETLRATLPSTRARGDAA